MNYAIDRDISPLGQIINPIGDRTNRERPRRPFPDPDRGQDGDRETEGGEESARRPSITSRDRSEQRGGRRDDKGGLGADDEQGSRIDIHVAALDGLVRFLPSRQKPHVARPGSASH